MAISYTQTDDTGSFGCIASELLGCSGLSGASDLQSTDLRACTVGGTPGVGASFINIGSSQTNVVEKAFACDVASGVSWDAGTWTIRLNITASNMNLTWSQVYVCRINSTCVNQETIGSNTAVNISLSTTGVKSTTVSGSAVTPSAGDKVLIVLAFTNGAMSSQSAQYTPDQDIDSPFTASSDVSITSGLGQLTLTGQTPTVFLLDPKTVSTGLGQLAITGHVPTLAVSDNVNVSAGLGALTLTGHVPTPVVTDNVFITAGAGALTITGHEPTVSKHITTELGQLTLTGHAPTVFASTNVLVSAALGELLLTGHAPTLAKSENTFITPDAGALTLTGLQPTAQATANVFISPNAGTLDITGHVPTIQSGASVTANPDVGLLTLTGLQPTVQTTAHVSVNTQTGALVITGHQPGVSTDASVAINTALGQLMLSGHIPSVDVTGQVIPVETPTPAGRSRRRERLIARHKGQEYEFDSIDQLEAFVEKVTTPAQKRRGKKPSIKIVVPQRVEQELARFDLPSIQAELARFDWRSAIRTWNRYESLRQSQPLDLEQSRRQQAFILARQIELEDEELMLL
jgi:hypothetical protein